MHRRCRPVQVFDESLTVLAADMVATMYAAEGVGLAANQVGVDLQVFVFDCHDDDGVRHRGVACNPRLEVPQGRDRALDDSDEGCLSLPGAFVACARPDFAAVSALDLAGEPVHYAGSGLLARCLQHEFDHLQGVVFGDRLSTRARKMLYKEAAKAAAAFPPGWPAQA
jgi:peptide deformylase